MTGKGQVLIKNMYINICKDYSYKYRNNFSSGQGICSPSGYSEPTSPIGPPSHLSPYCYDRPQLEHPYNGMLYYANVTSTPDYAAPDHESHPPPSLLMLPPQGLPFPSGTPSPDSSSFSSSSVDHFNMLNFENSVYICSDGGMNTYESKSDDSFSCEVQGAKNRQNEANLMVPQMKQNFNEKSQIAKKQDNKKMSHANQPVHPKQKTKKKCANCQTKESPSWRRSIAKETKGKLLCNACGLYEKTTKRRRMLVTNEDSLTKVIRKRDARVYCCAVCGTKNACHWRTIKEIIKCEPCHRSGF
ncbi:hypothetical protein RMCBS344292_15874 [Rhizopus microsporus]|nr:hypothetical protein RMCBS344292_15874 [Rhizopus microsporus]